MRKLIIPIIMMITLMSPPTYADNVTPGGPFYDGYGTTNSSYQIKKPIGPKFYYDGTIIKLMNRDLSSLIRLQVAEPTANSDAATKYYVDNSGGGASSVTFENLNANGDVGFGASQVPEGSLVAAMDGTSSDTWQIDNDNTGGIIKWNGSDLQFRNAGDTDYINGSFKSIVLDGTSVTSTASELNYVDVTPGTLTANKAIVVDGSSKIDTMNILSADIDGGTIDGTTIGGTTPAAGAFTTLSSTSTTGLPSGTTIGNLTLSNGSITDSSGVISLGKVTLAHESEVKNASGNAKFTISSKGNGISHFYLREIETERFGFTYLGASGYGSVVNNTGGQRLYLYNSGLIVFESKNSMDIELTPSGNVNITANSLEMGGTEVIDSSRNVSAGTVTGDLITTADTTANRPGSPVTGQMYFDTDLGKMIVYNGSAWVNMDGSSL